MSTDTQKADRVNFRKAPNRSFYFVHINFMLAGSVKRVEDWTVRGRRVRWEAYRNGDLLGSGRTRVEAAEHIKAALARVGAAA